MQFVNNIECINWILCDANLYTARDYCKMLDKFKPFNHYYHGNDKQVIKIVESWKEENDYW